MSPSNQTRRFEPAYGSELMAIAQDDLRTARFLYKGLMQGEIRGENLFYMVQQAIEKTLKAVLMHLEQPVPMVHDLGILLAKIPQEQEPPFGYEINKLSEFAAIRRYEQSGLSWGVEEAEEALALGNQALDWAQGIVNPSPN